MPLNTEEEEWGARGRGKSHLRKGSGWCLVTVTVTLSKSAKTISTSEPSETRSGNHIDIVIVILKKHLNFKLDYYVRRVLVCPTTYYIKDMFCMLSSSLDTIRFITQDVYHTHCEFCEKVRWSSLTPGRHQHICAFIPLLSTLNIHDMTPDHRFALKVLHTTLN